MSEIEKALRLISDSIVAHPSIYRVEIEDGVAYAVNSARSFDGFEDAAEALRSEPATKPLELSPEIIRTLASWPGDGYGPEIRAVLEAARKAVA